MKTQTPYEFLVRMDKDGAIVGAHVKFLTTYTDDGVVVSQVEGEAQPVSVAGSAGFPLETILSAIHSAALVNCVAAQAECAKHEVTIAALEAELAALSPKVEETP